MHLQPILVSRLVGWLTKIYILLMSLGPLGVPGGRLGSPDGRLGCPYSGRGGAQGEGRGHQGDHQAGGCAEDTVGRSCWGGLARGWLIAMAMVREVMNIIGELMDMVLYALQVYF